MWLVCLPTLTDAVGFLAFLNLREVPLEVFNAHTQHEVPAAVGVLRCGCGGWVDAEGDSIELSVDGRVCSRKLEDDEWSILRFCY